MNEIDQFRIRWRDGFRCQVCERRIPQGIRLIVNQRIPQRFGGTTLDNNLWSICMQCNDAVTTAFSTILNPESVQQALQYKSGLHRLKILLTHHKKDEVPISVLKAFVQPSDWRRALRELKARYGLRI